MGEPSGKTKSGSRARYRRALHPADPAPALAPAAQERYERGAALREELPHGEHAGWDAPADRPDPVGILEQQARTRVPELVPIRYGRMLASPFAFLRGSAAVMAWDLSRTATSGLRVQCCGDAHLANFGTFAAPDRRLVFDLNDFDETLPAPFEWDLKRLAASFAVAARDKGFSDKDSVRAVIAVSASYREWMRHHAASGFLDVWYARIEAQSIVEILERVAPKSAAKRAKKNLRKARSKTNLGALSRFAERVDGGFRIRADPPIVVRFPHEDDPAIQELIHGGLEDYAASMSPDRRELLRRYRFVDFARKVVGVGSVGTQAAMLLMMGDRDDDPLFLQLKEAQPSVLAPYAGPSEYEHHGERVVVGQRMMQAASDPFLGWLRGRGKLRLYYYVRQLRDMKGSPDVTQMVPKGFEAYARLCGGVLARAHARTGDAAAIAGYLGDDDTFDRAVAEFAAAYAGQTTLDHTALQEAANSGRVTVDYERS